MKDVVKYLSEFDGAPKEFIGLPSVIKIIQRNLWNIGGPGERRKFLKRNN